MYNLFYQNPDISILKNINPEDKLLLCCVRSHIDSEINKHIKELINNNLDWEYLLQKALQHKIKPLLYWNLKEIHFEKVPDDIIDNLKNYFRANSKRNIFLTIKLLKLLNLFKENGITAIPYKGPVQSSLAYSDIFLRQFDDLDILFYKEDISKAKDLLVLKGYRPEPELTKNQEIALFKYLLEHAFIHDEDKITVGVHWRIAPEYFTIPIDYEYLWENRKPISILDQKVLTFSPEDSLLIPD